MGKRKQVELAASPNAPNGDAPKPTMSDSALLHPMTLTPSLVQQFNRIGGNLSPAAISSILAMADIGRRSRFVDLTHECRQKDGHMQCCLQAAEIAISALPWEIDAPKNANRKERKMVELATDALTGNEFFPLLIEHFAGEGVLFGDAHSESIWDVIDGAMIPVRFKNLSCRRFGHRLSDGELMFDPRNVLEADVNVSGIDLLSEYPIGKFLGWRPRINGDVPAREGYARMLVWLALGRNWTYKDWLELAELAWKPKRLGKYNKGASDEDKLALIAMLERVMSGGVGIFPENTEPQMLWPSAGSGARVSTHKELEVWIAGEMSKAILGSSDIVEPSENGAKAAVETRSELKTELRNARARGIAAAIQPLIVAITQLNAGPTTRPGTFKFITVDPPDLDKFASSVEKFKRSKVRMVEAWVHDQAGMPTPKPDDILVGDTVDENGKIVREPVDGADDDDGDDDKGKDDNGESGEGKPKKDSDSN
jgi:phage gp29-like protein